MPRLITGYLLSFGVLALALGGAIHASAPAEPPAPPANPPLRFKPMKDVQAEFVGPERAVKALQGRRVRSLSMATADFDEDGVPDIVSGFKRGGHGILSLQRGNVDAIFPHSPQARAGRAASPLFPAPFLPEARLFETSFPPDLMGAGDFDADGHPDVVIASKDRSALLFLRGDGQGGFSQPLAIELPGRPTFLVAGEFNRRDGLEDVVVAITGPDGPRMLLFQSPEGAFRNPAVGLVLPAPAPSIVLAQLDEALPLDILAAAGDRLVILHGRDRHRVGMGAEPPESEPLLAEWVRLPFEVVSVAAGRFLGLDGGDVALLSRSGDVYVSRIAALRQMDRQGLDPKSVLGPAASFGTTSGHLLRARVSGWSGDDLLLVDRTEGRVQALPWVERIDRHADPESAPPAVPAMANRPRITLPARPAPAAILPMRLDADGRSDLVLLTGDSPRMQVLPSGPLGIFTVNATDDTDDGSCDTHCSLREAILASNANGMGTNIIEFDIPGPTPHVIEPDTNLPSLEAPVVIDGTSEPDYAGIPVVVIDGATARLAEPAPRGLQANAPAPISIQGLAIVNFDDGTVSPGVGVEAVDAILEGNYIGLTPSGAAAPNSIGVSCHRLDCQIGGTVPAARNVISGNSGVGVQIVDRSAVTIQGNYIGTDPAGVAARSNGEGVVLLSDVGALSLLVGGTAAGARNVIAGNDMNVRVDSLGLGVENIVQGNYIGTDVSGLAALAGTSSVGVGGGSINARIGGTAPGARNVIAGNGGGGIVLSGDQALIEGNYVGLGVDGDTPVGNGDGVVLQGASNCDVGGTVPAARNVVSGNASRGILVDDGNLNTIAGNFIGVDAAGTASRPNDIGVSLRGGAFNMVVGVASGGNVISGNTAEGVRIEDVATAANWVSSNLVGLAADGTSALGNGSHGIRVTDSSANLIGGTEVAFQNVIAFNGGDGIRVSGTSALDNAFLVNSLHDNAGLGIDLAPVGVNANDPQDPDEGANHGQNFPVVTLAQTDGGTVRVDGALDSLPLSDFTVRVYVSDVCDASGHGEGRAHLGSFLVSTDAGGAGTFSETLPGSIGAGEVVTATASHAGSTSEFSACEGAVGVPPGVVTNVRFDSASPETLAWDSVAGAVGYIGHIGTLSTLAGLSSPSADSCGGGDLTTTEVTLPPASNPPPGEMIWILLTASGPYGEGAVAPGSGGPRDFTDVGSCQESCAHDRCAVGGPLVPACTLCASIVCAKDPSCCNPNGGSWGAQCVQEVRTVCRSLLCPESQGQCVHSLCDAGGMPLVPGCDSPPLPLSCTAEICQVDPHCCQQIWDDACVAKVGTVCGYGCL